MMANDWAGLIVQKFDWWEMEWYLYEAQRNNSCIHNVNVIHHFFPWKTFHEDYPRTCDSIPIPGNGLFFLGKVTLPYTYSTARLLHPKLGPKKKKKKKLGTNVHRLPKKKKESKKNNNNNILVNPMLHIHPSKLGLVSSVIVLRWYRDCGYLEINK